MDWKSLFFSLDGRINRKQFWIGVVILMIAGIIVHFAVTAMMGINPFDYAAIAGGTIAPDEAITLATRTAWASLLAFVIIGYPTLALMVKRRHDRGKPGTDVGIYFVLYLLVALIQAFGLGFEIVAVDSLSIAAPAIWLSVLNGVVGILAIYLIVVCGFLKGYEGENAYGPDPIPDMI